METPIEKTKIVFDSVTQRYISYEEDLVALRNLSFEVFDTEILGIVGPSGCGKTTILNLIAGFLAPTSGEIFIDGKPAGGLSTKCGMVFQSDAAFPWMTVKQNIGYGINQPKKGKIAKLLEFLQSTQAKNGKCEKGDDLVEHYIELLGLQDFANNYPRQLSGGMRKRVELGRAYTNNPAILLLDEPFGSLDVLTKQEMQLLLNRIWEKDRKTVIFVTHDVEEAIFLSHRVLVMTPRPGTIKEAFQVPFEMPREHTLKLSEPFLDLRRRIVTCLESDLEKQAKWKK